MACGAKKAPYSVNQYLHNVNFSLHLADHTANLSIIHSPTSRVDEVPP